MSKSEREIMNSRDARDWADFFVKTMRENNPKIFNAYQEDALHAIMLTWFANAMTAMYDSIHNNEIQELKKDATDMANMLYKIDMMASVDDCDAQKLADFIVNKCSKSVISEAIDKHRED